MISVKLFSRKDCLKSPLLVHTDERLHKCDSVQFSSIQFNISSYVCSYKG